MQYFGGKYRIANALSEVIHKYLRGKDWYVEPFVGGASVISRIMHPRRMANDSNVALINMFRALCDGWEPPDTVSEQEYINYKNNPDMNDPLTAFIAVGCSFSGKWFGGYARNSRGDDYVRNAKSSLFKKLHGNERNYASNVRSLSGLFNIIWNSVDYRQLEYPPNSVIYCDPPYQGTTGYAATGTFDWKEFWEFCRQKQYQGHIVLVSEYRAPDDFITVRSIETKTEIRTSANGRETRTEKLFMPST